MRTDFAGRGEHDRCTCTENNRDVACVFHGGRYPSDCICEDLPRSDKPCPVHSGAVEVPYVRCTACSGSGVVAGSGEYTHVTCGECLGTGERLTKEEVDGIAERLRVIIPDKSADISMLHDALSEVLRPWSSWFERAQTVFADRNKSYGTANIAEAGAAGVVARLRDKLARADNLLDSEEPEKAIDTALDIANYGIILAMLFAGEWPGQRNGRDILITESSGKQLAMPQHEGDVGYDLRAAEDVWLDHGKLGYVKTGVSIAMPPGVWCRMAGRSGMMRSRGVIVPDNVIDTGYTGELAVPMVASHSDGRRVHILAGERIAQLIFYRAVTPKLRVVGKLPETARGTKGFGSTGEK